jgi:serine/threonine protein kinase
MKIMYENHVVKLVDIISSSANHDIIVMPWLSPLDTTDLGDMDRNLLLTQFLNGIWFLHKSGVTHLDLKLGNVLVKYSNGSLVPHLSIINFSVSIRVNNDKTLITGFHGTLAWTVPEVGRKGGPKMMYSAIQADRWSCGLMLQYLCPDAALFSDVRKKLLSPDPRRQPSLDNMLRMLQESSHRAKHNVAEDMDPVLQK